MGKNAMSVIRTRYSGSRCTSKLADMLSTIALTLEIPYQLVSLRLRSSVCTCTVKDLKYMIMKSEKV